MARPSLSIDLPDERATSRLGEDIAAVLETGDVIALRGDLGMGKTTLARAIIRAVAGDAELDVPSPTFTLVQAYAARVPVQHFDLYRLGAPDELEELGFAEAASEGAVLIEWPERAGDAMPADVVVIDLAEAGAGRRAGIAGNSAFIERLERSLAIRGFLDASGYRGARRHFLVGDASTRAYETIEVDGQPPVILMNSPKRPDGPPIRDGKPYSQIAHLAEDVAPFAAIGGVLRQAGFAAPAILARDLDAGMLVVENLGRDGVLDEQGGPVAERYLAAARLLADIHAIEWPREIEIGPGVTHPIPDYDHGAMAIETELLVDWYVPHVLGRPASEAERRDFSAAWTALFRRLDRAETSLVLRDYHSPNLIWRKDRSGNERMGLIDFQDAMIGPAAYDVASLAMDARVTIEPVLERAAVEAYCGARGQAFDRPGFDEAYAIVAAQRNTKILGIFVRLKLRDGKPGYVRHLPRLRDYLRRALAHPSLAELAELYRRLGVVDEPASAAPARAMVLAAGLGKRMRPLTDTLPKPLIQIAGKALLDWGLDALAAAGVETAIVNVHHLGGQVVDHVRGRTAPAVVFSDETDLLLDSAGGIIKALPMLGDQPFYVLNADTFWIDAGESNLRRLALEWDGARMDILLMLADPADATGHSGPTDFLLDADGRLARSHGAPAGVIYAGAAIVHPRLFKGVAPEPHSLNRYFDSAAATGRLFGMVMRGHWITVGTPDAIAPAEAAVARHGRP